MWSYLKLVAHLAAFTGAGIGWGIWLLARAFDRDDARQAQR